MVSIYMYRATLVLVVVLLEYSVVDFFELLCTVLRTTTIELHITLNDDANPMLLEQTTATGHALAAGNSE
jgi:hypothetical protein